MRSSLVLCSKVALQMQQVDVDGKDEDEHGDEKDARKDECVCICMYVYMYVWMYVWMCMYVCLSVKPRGAGFSVECKMKLHPKFTFR